MLKLRAVGAVAAVAVIGSMTGEAAAGGDSFETTVVDIQASCSIDGVGFEDLCIYSGVIDSDKAKCRRGRTVRIFALVDPGAQAELVDTATTSRRGGFGGIGRPSDVSAFKVRVLKKTFGRGERKVTCLAAGLTSA